MSTVNPNELVSEGYVRISRTYPGRLIGCWVVHTFRNVILNIFLQTLLNLDFDPPLLIKYRVHLRVSYMIGGGLIQQTNSLHKCYQHPRFMTLD